MGVVSESGSPDIVITTYTCDWCKTTVQVAAYQTDYFKVPEGWKVLRWTHLAGMFMELAFCSDEHLIFQLGGLVPNDPAHRQD